LFSWERWFVFGIFDRSLCRNHRITRRASFGKCAYMTGSKSRMGRGSAELFDGFSDRSLFPQLLCWGVGAVDGFMFLLIAL
jgi:hypothetical protein